GRGDGQTVIKRAGAGKSANVVKACTTKVVYGVFFVWRAKVAQPSLRDLIGRCGSPGTEVPGYTRAVATRRSIWSVASSVRPGEGWGVSAGNEQAARNFQNFQSKA